MSDAERSLNRREFIGAAAVAGYAVTDPKSSGCEPQRGGEPQIANTKASLGDNVYTRLLGVRPHLGAHEHISRLGGGRMSRQVLNAMTEANEYFVDMRELNAAAGRRAAELLGAEAALITAGGFSGMILGAAACLTGSDQDKVHALPHPYMGAPRVPHSNGAEVRLRPRVPLCGGDYRLCRHESRPRGTAWPTHGFRR
ncbi:MAG: hypothetical protein ACREOG_10210, partial [Gemmatimonadaceae bacterium]